MSDKESPTIPEKHVELHDDGHAHHRKWSLHDTEAQALGELRTVEVGLSAEEIIETLNIDAAEERRILWKVDLRLIPFLTFLYL